jgi:hypothetical protein
MFFHLNPEWTRVFFFCLVGKLVLFSAHYITSTLCADERLLPQGPPNPGCLLSSSMFLGGQEPGSLGHQAAYCSPVAHLGFISGL